MYPTFTEGPLQSILSPKAVQWVMGILDLPLNVTNWVLVGSSSPNLAVQLHIRLKFECSVAFGYLKADIDELPKDAIELTTSSLREADSLAPIYWEFDLPQLDKGFPVDWTGVAYVPNDVDDLDLESTRVDPKSKPKPKAKPKATPKKGSAKDADGDANGGGTAMPQSTPNKTPKKRDRSPVDESAAEPADRPTTGSMESQNVTSPGRGSQASQSHTPEGLGHFLQLVSGGATQTS